MKQLFFLAIIALAAFNASAQTTAVLANQKDGWGLTYTYIGEVKNGKANGMGVAKYSSGNVTRYVGSFVNGMYNGKGTMLFTSGEFLTGNWSNGKLSGKGTNLTSDGSLYIGEFANGEKNGNGVLFYKNNGFMKGQFKDDKLNGRCVNLWSDGNIISDNIFVDDKRNGAGFQYEAASKKLYEGVWKDDKWVDAGTATFASFLQAPSFTGESTSEHILMGPVTTRGFLRDTAYYYDLPKKKRYFGLYSDGKLDDGILIGDDSTRFMGQLDDAGAKGYCYDFKYGSYYSEGNYTKDYLDGDILDINLKKKTVYYGKAVNGEFTGKAYFFNDKDAMYSGDYLHGDFTGQGYRLESSGRCTMGTWKEGVPVKVTSITTPKGDVISGTPKTFTEAMNIIVKDYTDYYDNISGTLADGDDIDAMLDALDDSDYTDYYNSLTTFPNSTKRDVIATDFDLTNYYSTTLIETTDAVKAKAKYNEIAKQLQALTLNNSILGKPVKLQGTVNAPSGERTESAFTLNTTSSDYENFHVWLVFAQESDTYVVKLELGEKPED